MKKLGIFVKDINEGRRPGSTNKPKDAPAPPPELKDVQGVDAEDNDSEGLWAIDEPTEDDITKGIDRETLNRNKKRILMRMKAKKPFFVQGEAGWAKTSIITQLAKQCGRSVLTVYLDKAEATDLGGIPVPTETKGHKHVQYLLPQWAALMKANPKKQFLLFFDEMNQAQPDVMNALMPIVLKNEIAGKKFDNFIVGAAGNFESENGAVSELSGPLLSRFGGVITWESGNWSDSFKYLHKKWDEKLGKDIINTFEEYAPELFKNPRDVESFLMDTVYELKQDKDFDMFDVDDYVDQITEIAKEDLSRSQENKVKELAESIFKYMNKSEKESSKSEDKKPSRKDVNMIPKNLMEKIKQGIQFGYIDQEENGKYVKYGISRENINILIDLCDDGSLNAEILERIINKAESEGVKFKFEKNKQWKDAGYKDPNED